MRKTIAITFAAAFGLGLGAIATGARNSAGTYSNVSGPFIGGTVISKTDFNNQWSDYAAALTDSLSRSGKGGMTSPLLGIDGTVGLPSFAFTAEPGTGIYRRGLHDLGLAVNGAGILHATSSGVAVTGTLGVSGDVTLQHDLAVSGATTLTGAVGLQNALTVAGATTLTGAVGLQNALTVAGATTLTGGATLGSDLRLTAGDVYVSRAGAATQGAVYLGSAGTHYLWFDGTYYQMPTAELQIATPTQAGSAATKAYADTMAQSARTFSSGANSPFTTTISNQVVSIVVMCSDAAGGRAATVKVDGASAISMNPCTNAAAALTVTCFGTYTVASPGTHQLSITTTCGSGGAMVW